MLMRHYTESVQSKSPPAMGSSLRNKTLFEKPIKIIKFQAQNMSFLGEIKNHKAKCSGKYNQNARII